MFIAHLPAGYLPSERLSRNRPDRAGLIATGLAASVLPDTDLAWFYLASDRQNPHHDFLWHWPLFWIAGAGIGWLMARTLGWRRAEPFIGVALACLLLHMVLDSIAAGIGWLRPFSDWQVNLVAVPARHGWWVWNFILHWTFLLELAICVWAALVLWRSRRQVARA